MRTPLLFLLPAAMLLSGCESLKKDPEVLITVHSQGTDMDSKKTIFRRPVNGRSTIFKIIPEFTNEGVVAFHPFPAEDGTYGVALKLDFKGTNALDMVTRMRRGEILLTMVNGTVVDVVQIDQPVTDGIFTIWRGLPEELIAVMDKKYPRIKNVKSSSEFIDMTPSTRKEKREAKRRAASEIKEKEKAAEAAAKRKAKGEFEPEAPNGELVPLGQLLDQP